MFAGACDTKPQSTPGQSIDERFELGGGVGIRRAIALSTRRNACNAVSLIFAQALA